jgi:hypothetical protein
MDSIWGEWDGRVRANSILRMGLGAVDERHEVGRQEVLLVKV